MFVRQPSLLVFNDISSALDVEKEQTLWERLIESPKTTCLVVSNRCAALQRVTHVIVLKDGYIEAERQFSHLLETCFEMQYLWKGKKKDLMTINELHCSIPIQES